VAKELGVAWAGIAGSGRTGRIVARALLGLGVATVVYGLWLLAAVASGR